VQILHKPVLDSPERWLGQQSVGTQRNTLILAMRRQGSAGNRHRHDQQQSCREVARIAATVGKMPTPFVHGNPHLIVHALVATVSSPPSIASK
jgi:hypothetical protein